MSMKAGPRASILFVIGESLRSNAKKGLRSRTQACFGFEIVRNCVYSLFFALSAAVTATNSSPTTGHMTQVASQRSVRKLTPR